jgi:hypothetical protein
LHFSGTAFTEEGKSNLFCHSERSEESLFGLSPTKEREIPRFARNDKKRGALFPQPVQPVWFWRSASAKI